MNIFQAFTIYAIDDDSIGWDIGDFNNWVFDLSNRINLVAIVTLLSGSIARAIKDELPICQMFVPLPYVLIFATKSICSYEEQWRCRFFLVREYTSISPMTCLFINICSINLLCWLQRSWPNRLLRAMPSPGQPPTGQQVTTLTIGPSTRLITPITPQDSNVWDDCWSDWMLLMNRGLYSGEWLPVDRLESTGFKQGSSVARCLITDLFQMPSVWTCLTLELLFH